MAFSKNIINRVCFIISYPILYLLIGCSGHPIQHNLLPKKDSITKITAKQYPHHDEGDDGPTPSLSSIMKDELKSYKETIKFDTFVVLKSKDTMAVKLRYFCTYDNKIKLPSKYVKIYNLKTFQTHSFITTLKLKVNKNVVFNGLIKKNDFDSLLHIELKKYAVLMSPNISFENDMLNLQYSISIPLTDVGNGFTVTIDKNGNKKIVKD